MLYFIIGLIIGALLGMIIMALICGGNKDDS